MEILLWLLPSAVATGLAIVWVGWRERRELRQDDRSEQAYERFAAAVQRPLDARGRRSRALKAPARPRDRSTGVAVRPSRRTPAA